jgi:hypothetical protein
MTFGNAAAAEVRLIMWRKNYRGLAPPRLGDLAGSCRSGFTTRATTDHRLLSCAALSVKTFYNGVVLVMLRPLFPD